MNREIDTPDMALENRPLSEGMAIRFGATLLANLLRGGFSFISGVLIARGLGASNYGDLNFLLGSFAAFSQLLDMGTSSAFYTFISQRRRTWKFFSLYFSWLISQFLTTVIVVGFLLPADMLERIWVGHDRQIVLLAFAASFLMTQLWGMVIQLGEASRKTVVVQAATVAQSMIHLGLVVVAVEWEWLTVRTVLWLLTGEYAILALLFGRRLMRGNVVEYSNECDRGAGTVKQFAVYCKPLVVYVWVGFLYAFADRWLLQQFGGAEQQGFFAIGQQFANISLLATASILKVFWKEIAEAHEHKDHQRMQRLYDSVKRGLFCVAAWISCLLIPYSREILSWTVGSGYAGAWLCLALMFLFPIYQSMGQIQGIFFYASGATRSHTQINLLITLISLPVTYLILAPESGIVAGFGLGALGLALKIVVLQVVVVNLQAYVIARTNGWPFDYWYQGLLLLPLLALAIASKWMVEHVLDSVHPGGEALPVMLLGGAVYAGLSLVLLYHARNSAGLPYEEIRWAMDGVMRRMRTVVS
jgi:O-antigen/teichoic acid export membrane protein